MNRLLSLLRIASRWFRVRAKTDASSEERALRSPPPSSTSAAGWNQGLLPPPR
jgi:hypothetical protein